MKYDKIIELLTKEQKIALLTDKKAYLNRAIIGKGVPKVTFTELFVGENMPSQAELASTFSGGVVYNLAKRCLDGIKGGVVILPSANVRTIAGGSGFSEDPYLNGVFIEACAKAASEHGALPCCQVMDVRKEDELIVDEVPDKSAMIEYYYKAFGVLKKFNSCGIIGGEDVLLYSEPLGISNNSVKFSAGLRGKDAVLSFKNGFVMCFGAREDVEDALNYYGVLIKDGDEAAATEACLKGEAMSPEMLDEYVSKAIDFAFECKDESDILNGSGQTYDFSDEVAYKAALDSVVLLENKGNVLPLTEKNKVAIIGEEPEKLYESVCKYKTEVVSIKLEADTTVRAVLGQLHGSDVLVVLLKGENGKLKKSEYDLISGLSHGYGRIISVLPSDWQGDVDIADSSSALLTAPSFGPSHKALAEILCGVHSPSGKLPVTLYNKRQSAVDSLVAFKNLKANRIGRFVGYRRYIEDGDEPRYPFGHGLSYARLDYSKVKIIDDKVTFFVKNRSQIDTEEVVQIYLGKSYSSLIRPKFELCVVKRIALKAEEKLRVEIVIPKEAYESYSEKRSEWAAESGNWRIYVCRSSLRVIGKEETFREGKELPSDGRKRYEYLLSESNIKNDFYVSHYEKPKKANPLFRIGLIVLGILSVIGVLEVGQSISYFDNKSLFVGLILLIISIPLYIICLVKTISGRVERKKLQSQSEGYIMSNLSSSGTDRLFHAAFDDMTNANGVENNDGKKASDDDYTYEAESKDSVYVEGLDVNTVIDRIIAFGEENGVGVSKECCAEFVAAMATSRLVVIRQNEKAVQFFGAVKSALSGELFYDFSSHKEVGGLVFSEKDGFRTPLEDALRSSGDQSEGFTFMVMNYPDNADEDMMRPFYDYFRTPRGVKYITFESDEKVKTLPVSSGLWVFLMLDGKSVDQLPYHLLEEAAFVDLDLTPCESKKHSADSLNMTCKQFEKTVDNLTGEFTLEENNWKKIDKFADYMAKFVDYKLGNREYTTMEKYFSVMLLAYKESSEVVDRGVASLLMPIYLSALSVAEKQPDESLINILERIFGEDNMPVSERMAMNAARSSVSATKEGPDTDEEITDETAEEFVSATAEE